MHVYCPARKDCAGWEYAIYDSATSQRTKIQRKITQNGHAALIPGAKPAKMAVKQVHKPARAKPEMRTNRRGRRLDDPHSCTI